MDIQKCIGILHRIKATPKGSRGALFSELSQAIDETNGAPAVSPKALEHQATNQTVVDLRNMLGDDGIRDNPRALASLARTLRQLR